MSQKSVGIITFHRAHNYGALLQCFALKKYIESLGHIVNIIDYWPDYHLSTYKFFPDFSKKSIKGKIKSIVLFVIGFFKIYKRSKGYKDFIKTHLDIETHISFKTANELSQLDFDVVVYGSDQIWWRSTLPTFQGYDLVYWGQQPKKAKRKITYAPSMGIINYDIEESNVLKKMLNNFDAISVRELIVKELIKSKLGIDTTLVLDPVFLIDKKYWEKFCNTNSKPFEIKEKYIFFYHLKENPQTGYLVENLAKYFDLRIIEIKGRVSPLKRSKRFMQTVDPIGFVQLIRNASFVVSTSFHGTAFSIIFEKHFYASGMGSNAERAKSLLKNLGIENRYIDNFNKPIFDDTIDYEQVNIKLEKLKVISKDFLINNI
jgi:hypothetical protein